MTYLIFHCRDVGDDGKFGEWFDVKLPVDETTHGLLEMIDSMNMEKLKTTTPFFLGSAAGAATFIRMDKKEFNAIKSGKPYFPYIGGKINLESFDSKKEALEYKKSMDKFYQLQSEFYSKVKDVLASRKLISPSCCIEFYYDIIF